MCIRDRGTAAAIPGTLVNTAAGGGERESVVFGHPSGTLKVGAQTVPPDPKRSDDSDSDSDSEWQVERVSMSRSARVLMEGWVRVPGDCF